MDNHLKPEPYKMRSISFRATADFSNEDPYKELRDRHHRIGISKMIRQHVEKHLRSMSTSDLESLQRDLIDKEWYEDAAGVRDIIEEKEEK